MFKNSPNPMALKYTSDFQIKQKIDVILNRQHQEHTVESKFLGVDSRNLRSRELAGSDSDAQSDSGAQAGNKGGHIMLSQEQYEDSQMQPMLVENRNATSDQPIHATKKTITRESQLSYRPSETKSRKKNAMNLHDREGEQTSSAESDHGGKKSGDVSMSQSEDEEKEESAQVFSQKGSTGNPPNTTEESKSNVKSTDDKAATEDNNEDIVDETSANEALKELENDDLV